MKALQWFRKWQFDKRRYAAFWVWKFPSLAAFLWIQFQQFKSISNLVPFYPFPIEPLENADGFQNLMNFPHQICKILDDQINEGAVEMRYTFGKDLPSLVLELRVLKPELLEMILDRSSAVEMAISTDKVSVKWYNSQGDITDKRVTRIPTNSGKEKCVIYYAGNVRSISERIIARKISKDCGSKLIIFSNIESRDETVQLEEKEQFRVIANQIASALRAEFLETPVKWKDICESTQREIIETGEATLKNNAIKISDIFPKCETVTNELLNTLNGNILNKLIRKDKPLLLKKHQLPLSPTFYIERHLVKEIEVKSQILRDPTEDIFAVTGVGLEVLKHMIDKETETIAVVKNIYDLNEQMRENVRIFLFEIDAQDLNIISKYFQTESGTGDVKNSHLLSYVRGDAFHWIGSHGSTAILEQHVPHFLRDSVPKFEQAFLQSLEESTRMIFIADSPGMGKSMALASLADKLQRQSQNHCVVYFEMLEFVEDFKRSVLSKETVIKAFTNKLCSSKFEEALISYWLTVPVSEDARLHFDILLDGLDEVRIESRECALEILRLLLTEFPNVRTFVTLRDHMKDSLQLSDDTLCLKLQPFSKENQVDFLIDYWLEKFPENEEKPGIDELHHFAEKCTKIPLCEFDRKKLQKQIEVADNPLQCRILAEIFESKVIQRDLTLETNLEFTLAKLYEIFFERKLEVYLREKKGLSSRVSMNDYLVNTMRDQMYLIHTYFAIKLLFSEKIANEFKTRLIITASNSEMLEVAVLEHGIMQMLSPPSFLHRTFAEFIVARFVWQVIMGKLHHITEDDPSFQNFLWNEILAVSTRTITVDESCVEHIGEFDMLAVCHFLDGIWGINMPGWECHSFRYFVARTIDWLQKTCFWPPSHYEYCALFGTTNRMGYSGIMSLILKTPKRYLSLFVTALLHTEFDFLKYLIEECRYGPDTWHKLSDYDSNGYGVLHWTLLGLCRVPWFPYPQNLKEMLKYFVKKDGSILELRDAHGRTPLLLFLQEGVRPRDHLAMPGLILDYGLLNFLVISLKANVNAMDNYGNTILHVPQYYTFESLDKPEIKEKLLLTYFHLWSFALQNGCNSSNINAINSEGLTPLLSAVSFFGDAMANALRIFNIFRADFNVKDKNESTALHIAIERKFALAFIHGLIICGADITATNRKGQSALHLAVETESIGVVECLCEQFHANLLACDSEGKTVSQYKCSDGMRKYVKFQMKAFRRRERKQTKRKKVK